MRKVLVIALREYQAAVRTKAFIVSLVAMPVIFGGSVGIQMLLRDRVDTEDKRVAIIDYSGVLGAAIQQAAAARDDSEVGEEFRGNRDQGIFRMEEGGRRQVRPRYLIEIVDPPAYERAEETAFEYSEQVRTGALFAFVTIGPEVVNPGVNPERASVHYHSNSPTYDDIQDWLAGPVNRRLQELRFESYSLDPEVVARATRPAAVANLGLLTRDRSGQIKAAERTNEMANIFIPMSMMMLMFMLIMVGASPLVNSVLEEKMQRIAEVLLGSVAPFPLMLGKLLGMVGVSLTIAVVYLVGGYSALRYAEYDRFFPTHVLVWFFVYTPLAVLMYGALFAAIGAAVSDIREAQSVITPVMIVVVSPMFVWLNVVKEPNSTFALALSLIPPATPMLMTIRQAVPPGIPVWQPALGVVLVLGATIAIVVAAGRIFRVGLLMQGKGARIGDMLRWIISG